MGQLTSLSNDFFTGKRSSNFEQINHKPEVVAYSWLLRLGRDCLSPLTEDILIYVT